MPEGPNRRQEPERKKRRRTSSPPNYHPHKREAVKERKGQTLTDPRYPSFERKPIVVQGSKRKKKISGKNSTKSKKK